MQNISTNRQTAIRLRLSLFAGVIVAVVLPGLWFSGIFMNLRLRLNDVYFAPLPTSDNIVIIAIDDASLARYGSTPSEWSRSVYADLVINLISANPRVLAFDLLFSEAKLEDEQFARALSDLRGNEIRTRIVLADAGINNVSLTLASERETNAFVFADDLALSATIAAIADYRGYTNTIPDIDGIVRRHPSLLLVNNNLEYTFSIATYLAYLRIPQAAAEQVITPADNTLNVTAERLIPVDEYGLWQPYFFDTPATSKDSAFPIIALTDVVDGDFDATILYDKIVLVGLVNTAGLLDQYLVPSSTTGQMMAGVEIQAHAIESIIQSRFVKPLSPYIQGSLIVGLVAVATAIYVLPRWYIKLLYLVVVVLVWFIITSIIFSTTLVTIDFFDTLLAITVPFVISLGIDISAERWRRTQQQFLLDSLQRIAEQRLHVEQAANYILSDMKRIIPDANCTLSLYDETQPKGYLIFQQYDKSNTDQTEISIETYRDLRTHQTLNDRTIFPLAWQNHLLGLLVIHHPHKRRLSVETVQFIQEFVAQLAPNIDNMLLYHASERQKQLLDSVFSESPTGIAIIDITGTIVQHNDNLAVLLSLSETNMYGRSLPLLIGEKTEQDNLVETFQSGLTSNQMFSIAEVKIGTSIVRIDAAPLLAYDFWTVIIGDITSLVELSELKTQMLRIAAHDLKNPLSRIIGFAELLELRLQNVDERNRRYLEFIQIASQEMLNIIQDILNLERLRSGKVTMYIVNFAQMVKEVCASHQPDTIQKEQTFTMQLPDKPISVHADFGQLSQAVTNLVGNAIKYTPEKGSVSVRVYNEGDYVRFEVEDTGYGIPEVAQSKLFTEFFRAKSEATAHIAGTGLGLSLVKSVIDAHGGKVGFDSTEGVGSTFYFTLPAINMRMGNVEELA